MKWVDVAGCPGSGKSTLAYHVWPDKSVGWDGLQMPTEWQPFLNEIGKLFRLVDDHETYAAVIRMNDRTAKKMATVHRMPAKKLPRGPKMSDDPAVASKLGPLTWTEQVFFQSAWMQRILGFGWRLHQMNRDINLIRPALELMPVSVGVAFLEADLETLLQRNRARRNNPATAHEDRGFQCGHILACMPLAKEVMNARGVPIVEIDVQHQSIDAARQQLIAFAYQGTDYPEALRHSGEGQAISAFA